MKYKPLGLCWKDLGDGKVCERLEGHEGDCSPDHTVDFPIVADRMREFIEEHPSEASWDCPHCDWPPSYNPNDVANHYCGHCHHYCDEV